MTSAHLFSYVFQSSGVSGFITRQDAGALLCINIMAQLKEVKKKGYQYKNKHAKLLLY